MQNDMAIEAVKECFSEYGIADRVIEFDVSSATVDLAAQAVVGWGDLTP